MGKPNNNLNIKGATVMAQEKRRDKSRIVLCKGEFQRPNGTYQYGWTDSNGKRHVIYAKTLDELREKERKISKDKVDGIKSESRFMTVNDMFNMWKELKRGLKDNTFSNYIYMYNTFVRDTFGYKRISELKKSDVKRFYNTLIEDRGLKPNTLDNVHTVLHQVFEMAVDDDYIRSNPSSNVIREIKQAYGIKIERRKSLTLPEQKLFLDYLSRNNANSHWYPIFAFMLGTGLRVGEVTGLRWCDIDLDEGYVDVNHTLVYYAHSLPGYKEGCYFAITSPKTHSSIRQVPLMDFAREALEQEKLYQEGVGLTCNVTIDDYTDFVFLNRNGSVYNESSLNRALKRIIRDCNTEEFEKSETPPVLLPNFSCHNLRHTFTTRMVEAGVNIKVIQDALGHSDISTTMNIYADATKELKKSEFKGLDYVFR